MSKAAEDKQEIIYSIISGCKQKNLRCTINLIILFWSPIDPLIESIGGRGDDNGAFVQWPRTLASHARNRGSTPLCATNLEFSEGRKRIP